MAKASIEHVNLTVREPARSASLLESLFGWKIRWQGEAMARGHTIHVGNPANGETYVALYTSRDAVYGDDNFIKGRPFNHVGVEVDDIDAVERKVVKADLTPFSHGDYEPGRRFYFLDHDGIEFEVVSYAET